MFPNDDDIISRLFEGHDDLLEDVRQDFSVRLGEAEQPQGEFLHPDQNPTLQPIMTNAKSRWQKIRPQVLASLARIGPTVCGDEATSILKKFNFRCMEGLNPDRSRSLSSSAKGSGLRVNWPVGFGECSDGRPMKKQVRRRRTSEQASTPLNLISLADSFLSEGDLLPDEIHPDDGGTPYKAAEVLTQHRWMRHSSFSDRTADRYVHPNHPDHTIKVQGQRWLHHDLSGKVIGSGPNGASLQTHLSQKFEARGHGHHDEMDQEKPGCVCDQCGRTVTHREYSSGATTCCKNGSVIPEEDFGKTYEARWRPLVPYGGPGSTGKGNCQGCGADKRTTYIDKNSGFCQDCLEGIMADQHGNGHEPGQFGEECPKCREMNARGTTSIFGRSGPGSGFSTFPEDCGKTGPKSKHKDGRTYDNKEDVVEALIDQFTQTGVVLVQEDAGDPINSKYTVHMDRETVAPGSSYHNWSSHGHLHKIQNWLDQAGLGHDTDRLTSYGYEDVSLDYPSKEVAHQAAHKLDAVLPRASDAYHKDWLGGKGHHVMVGHYSGTDDEVPMFHGYTYPSHMEEATRGMQPRPLRESLQRDCHIFKAKDGKHYMHLAHEEYGDLSGATTYGPFDSFDATDKYLSDAHSNPGGFSYDDSGKADVPTKSPNGSPVHRPRRSRWGGWESIEEAKTPSCWGCGDDWKARWEPNDLANTKKSSKFGGARICPDCVGDPASGFEEKDFAGPARRSSMGPKGGDRQIDVFRLDPEGYHACGNCGFSGARSSATNCPECKHGLLRTVKPGQKHPYSESVAPGYLPKPNASNNAMRPNGMHSADTAPSASEALQDLHRRLGSALPELHALAVSTITDEKQALGMLFHELHTAHCDIGNVLSYHNQIPDLEMSELVQHYSKVVSEMIGALNPYMTKNPAVGIGPYHLGGPLHDSLVFAQSRIGQFEDVSEMLVKYREFVEQHRSSPDVPRLQEACSKLVDDQSWYQPKRAGTFDHDWSYGKGKPMAAGQRVKVNLPGHSMHGVTSRIVRQQSNQFAVENPASPGKVEFFGAHQLENA